MPLLPILPARSFILLLPTLLPRPTLYPLGFLCTFALSLPKSFRLWTLLLQDTLVQCVHFFWVVGLPTQAFVSAVANEGRDPFTAQTLDIISDDSGKNDVILMIHKVNAKLFVLPSLLRLGVHHL